MFNVSCKDDQSLIREVPWAHILGSNHTGYPTKIGYPNLNTDIVYVACGSYFLWDTQYDLAEILKLSTGTVVDICDDF